MKKALSIFLIIILFSSAFILTAFLPKISAEETNLLSLPASPYYITGTLVDRARLTSVSPNQIITVSPGQSFSITANYQIWQGFNPSEIDQLLFICSWNPTWPPTTGYYAGIYSGIPPSPPGTSGTASASFTAPTSPGTYYIWFCIEANYGYAQAANAFQTPLPLPAHIKVVVSSPAENSVGYWKFDEGTGVSAFDSSGNGNTGTVHGAQWIQGISGTALSFNGINNYVSASNSPSLDISGNEISVEYWVKFPSGWYAGIGSGDMILYDKGDAYTASMTKSTGKHRFNIPYVFPYPESNRDRWDANVWYHFVDVFDGSQIRIYINGALDKTETVVGSVSRSSLPLAIGSHCFGDSNFFEGAIDDFKIYNYVRTGEEILADYEAYGLVGYWKFDENSGSLAHDSSGNGNDGIIHTATWTANGKVGNALDFNGVDSWVEVPNSPSLTGLSQITLEAWIREDIIPTRPNGIISKCDGGFPPINAEYFLGTANGGQAFFEVDNGVAIFSRESAPVITQTQRWYHVAGTWTGDSYTIYVDGNPVASGTCTPQITLSNGLPVQIGRHGTWDWTYFNGIIDEVKIYNYARSTTQIEQDQLAEPHVINLAIVAARALDTMDIVGPFSAADFYAKVSIDNIVLTDSQIKSNDNDIYPEWSFSLTSSNSIVPIHIEIWDSDWPLSDNHVDIDKDSSDLDLDFTFDTASQALNGDIMYGYSQGGGGDGDRAAIWFNVGLDIGDRDDDGLFDNWETNGIRLDDKTVLDLPALGASPDHKDIFVEIDWMADSTRNHRPVMGASQAVIDAFAVAPVENPDGRIGINLHMDESNSVPLQNELTLWNGFDTIKAANFDQNRRFVYHYCLFAHNLRGQGSASGIAELPGNDFVVSLGSWSGGVGSFLQQSGTLMHELGHNLNLGHGGGDSVNYKPNYLSEMNYFFQTSGILPTGRLDYSRSALTSLNENNLDESVGIQDGNDYTSYYSPTGTVLSGRGTGLIDWNNDGQIGTSIQADINHDGQRTVLASQNDWTNILYNSRGKVDFEDGIHQTPETLTELDVPTYESMRNLPANPKGGLVVALQPKTVSSFSGKQVTMSVVLTNNENFDDTVSMIVSTAGFPVQSQANINWFDWNNVTVNVNSKDSITLLLHIEIPAGTAIGAKAFKIEAISLSWIKGYAMTSGGIVIK